MHPVGDFASALQGRACGLAIGESQSARPTATGALPFGRRATSETADSGSQRPPCQSSCRLSVGERRAFRSALRLAMRLHLETMPDERLEVLASAYEVLRELTTALRADASRLWTERWTENGLPAESS